MPRKKPAAAPPTAAAALPAASLAPLKRPAAQAAAPPKRSRPAGKEDPVDQAERLLEQNGDAEGAAEAAGEAMTELGMRLAHAATLKGRALLRPLLQALQAGKPPARAEFRTAWEQFQLALHLDPGCAVAKEYSDKVGAILQPEVEAAVVQEGGGKELELDVLVVGAGACGVGVGLMLTHVFKLRPERVLLVERGGAVGESFRRWPKEMRFISPSFNQQGWTKSFDLNSVAYGTSPAFMLHSEHPSGEEYARYLGSLARENELRVMTGRNVVAVRPFAEGGGFHVDLAAGVAEEPPKTLQSRYVIWAAGEFQYPRAGAGLFPGSELCLHNSAVRSWAELEGKDFVVIGGYESGIDAASNLALCGKRCTVLASTPCWAVANSDPSLELAPYTAQRLRSALASQHPPRLRAPFRVCSVEAKESGGFLVKATKEAEKATAGKGRAVQAPGENEDEEELAICTPQAPLLCTGFEGSVRMGAASELFHWGHVAAARKKGDEAGDDGEAAEEEAEVEAKEGGCASSAPLLNAVDESTKTPGLFLVGPAVRHEGMSFCFVYKFRQRFGIVAEAIARGLGLDTAESVGEARKQNMFLDDFSCCRARCGETC